MQDLKKRIHFVVLGLRCAIEAHIDTRLNRPENVYLGLTATFDGGGGQSQDRIREVGADFAEIVALLDLWDAHHLKKPTEKATAAVVAAMDALNGRRFGPAPDVSDAPDVSETDDVIDSRDVIKRIEIYRDAVSAFGVDPETRADDFDPDSNENGGEIHELLEELNSLMGLESDAGGAADWQYGETLIRESYFEDYARQTAEDTGAINRDSQWPNNCIDWEKAADQLKQDYSEVTFKGVTYYIRG